MSDRAIRIVEELLGEGIRACAACQKEHGIVAEPGTSHGLCKRHTLETFQDIVDNVGGEGAKRQLERYAALPENDPVFAPGIDPVE